MQALYTIFLLVLSNTFMTIAWYGHLKFKEIPWFHNLGLPAIIFVSWGVAFFEYCFQVPANRFGFSGNGGPFSLVQLKVIQEVITLIVFGVFVTFYFGQHLRWNHAVSAGFLVGAVFFAFHQF